MPLTHVLHTLCHAVYIIYIRKKEVCLWAWPPSCFFCVKNEGKDTWPSILGYFFMGVVTLKQKEKMTKGKSVKYKNNYEHLLILAIR